jgi:tricorn protease
VLYSVGNAVFVSPIAKVNAGEGRLAVADVEVKIDPRAEWTQIFNEAWRINRDYFYAPNMHGVNWEANRKKYAQFLPDASTKGDVNRIIQWMMSDRASATIAAAAATVSTPAPSSPADSSAPTTRLITSAIASRRCMVVSTGLPPPLAADRTRRECKVGEYIIAVNGVDVRAPMNIYAPFENTAGKIVELTLASNPRERERARCRSSPLRTRAR